MNVIQAAPEHVAAIVALTEEIYRFYGQREFAPVRTRARQVHDALFGDPPAAYALLAFDDDELLGMASYTFMWPAADLARSLFLKELFVTRRRQQSGIGTALMREVFDVADKHGCCRVEWTTDRDNVGAQRFYDELGMSQLPSKLFYRATREDFERGCRRKCHPGVDGFPRDET